MILSVKNTLEELWLHENAMENEDFDILIHALVNMPHLKILNLNVNRISGPYLRKFLDAYIKNELVNGLLLQNLYLSQN